MFVSKKNYGIGAIGRRRLIPRWPNDTRQTFKRLRLPGTKRPLMRFEGRFNPKTLRRELILRDKKPLLWVAGMLLLLGFPLLIGEQRMYSIFGIICIFASINLFWSLIIGTAGIQSFATLATVGIGAYSSSFLSISLGIPWPIMLLIGAVFGGLMGFLISIPARRLDGMYYALLTLGVSEFCRAYVVQSDELGSKFNGALFGGDLFISEDFSQTKLGMALGYIITFVLLVATLVVFRLVTKSRVGLLLRTAQAESSEDEAFASAIGIDYQRMRLIVFIVASASLGFIGAFYAASQGGASLSLFSIDQLLLLLAMIVIGGMGRAEGAVVGTVIVVFITQFFVDWGPWRIILVGALMLASVLFTRFGLFGLRQQLIEIRERRKALARSIRTSRYGSFLPEEGPEIHDKGIIAEREFEKHLRSQLRTWIAPEILQEHALKPLGQHSDHLERILIYFRKQPLANKYVVYCEIPFAAYRIVALSGMPGVPPRLVDDKKYPSLDAAYHAVFLRRISDLKTT
jgi:branched-chain amino acid transport system permease protein